MRLTTGGVVGVGGREALDLLGILLCIFSFQYVILVIKKNVWEKSQGRLNAAHRVQWAEMGRYTCPFRPSPVDLGAQRPSGQALWALSGRTRPFGRPLSPLAPPKHEFVIFENK